MTPPEQVELGKALREIVGIRRQATAIENVLRRLLGKMTANDQPQAQQSKDNPGSSSWQDSTL